MYDRRSRTPDDQNGTDRFSRQRKQDEYWEKRREKRERYAARGADEVWGRSPSQSEMLRENRSPSQSEKPRKERSSSYSEKSRKSRSPSYSEKKDRPEKHKKKKEKKSKKDRSEKKHKRRRQHSSSVSESEQTSAKVKKENNDGEWVEMTKELRDKEAQKAREEEAQFIGPQIPESLLAKADSSTSHFELDANDRKNMFRGDAAEMAAYAAQGKRIPRRGEIGLDSDEISQFEKVGYIMSGTRHKTMEAVRLRKENQVLTAEEKRMLSGFTQEQRKQKEEAVMSQFQSLVSSKRGL